MAKVASTKKNVPKTSAPDDRRPVEKRWSTTVLDPGFVVLPSVILRAQSRLHIDCVQLAVLLQLIDHWWIDKSMPYPSKKTLADRIGCSDKTVQRAIVGLEEEGLIRRKERFNSKGGQTSNIYDLAPLVAKLKPIAKEMLEAREEAKKTRRSPEKPGHRLRRSMKATESV